MAAAITPLSDTQCRTAKPDPSGKMRKLFDGGGLFLKIYPNGSKFWRLKYTFAGKEKLLALGAYPAISLAQARDARQTAKRQLLDNIDPATQKRIEKLAATDKVDHTFGAIANEWFDTKSVQWAKTNSSKIRIRLDNDVLPWLGNVPITEITAPILLKRLRAVQERGALDTARRIRQYMSQIFRYAIATARAQRDPAADLVGALPTPISEHFASIQDPKILGKLLCDIDQHKGAYSTRTALALAPMLFVRPGELRGMQWSELDFDRAEWRIPAMRQKLKFRQKHSNRVPDFIVPLPRQAIELLKELKPLHELHRRSEFVFPGERSPKAPMSDNTINKALRTLGWDGDVITGHGFRHTASTMLNESRLWSADAIEAQLAHQDPNAIRGIYNGAKYLDERKRMMQWWADHLDELKAEAKGALVESATRHLKSVTAGRRRAPLTNERDIAHQARLGVRQRGSNAQQSSESLVTTPNRSRAPR
jgi:integrase